MRVIYDNVHGGLGVTDAFADMLCVMGEYERTSFNSGLQRGRLRWISLAWTKRYWPRWLGEFKADEVKPLLVKWALRLRRRKGGYLYVMYRDDGAIIGPDGERTPLPHLISILHVPCIKQEVWDAGPHFTRTPPVEGWPKQIRC